MLRLFIWLTPALGAAAVADETRLLRMPDIHGDTVAFVYAGDIYTAPAAGGDARQLTAHVGKELFPKFSRDGRSIAFSAEYGGSRQVYVMPADGSAAPRQLTFYNDVGAMPPRGGFDYRVLDWTPDGRHVLVRANRLPWGPRVGRPFLVPVDGGMEAPLAVPETGGGMLSPDGSVFVYTPYDREFRTWKRYRGGRAQDVWTYDLAANTSRRLTDDPATDNQPLWVGDDIYFASDRGYTMNLYRHVDGAEPVAVTAHDEFDVLWPSAGPAAIVYENGGYLYRYVPGAAGSERLAIRVPGDRVWRMPAFVDAGETVESIALAPGGKRVLIGARGELFSVPVGDGAVRRLLPTPASREIHARWSADGRSVFYQSDVSGEYEIYRLTLGGDDGPVALTGGSTAWRLQPVVSPDGRHVAYSNVDHQLAFVATGNGRE
ncbi:MAG: protease, partial [Pseudomonadota bacterium]